jgi:hypothetical protein
VLISTKKSIRPDKRYSDPYWLSEPHTQGLFTVKDEAMIGKPENLPAIPVKFSFQIGTNALDIEAGVLYKWTDPVKGELSRPFDVVPPLFINLGHSVMIFPNEQGKAVDVLIKSSSTRPLQGTLSLQLPEGWRSEPAEIKFALTRTGEEQHHSFNVFPSATEMSGTLKAVAKVDGKTFNQGVSLISYDHIPIQTLLPEASSKLIRLDLPVSEGTIGYIKGAGDDVPAALRNMGFEVWELKNEEVTLANLKRLKAVVLGVRAVNTNERMEFMMPGLLEYAKSGGTLIVQYNTNFDLETDMFSPFPLTISRDRVTEEDADVRILEPEHRVMNYPNKITPRDFDGWVQERGLYFPNKWDSAYHAVLSMNDKGETPKDGSLLVAKYGEGYYIYTGLSFFRELPEGVSGAYKLFANLLSIGDSPKPVEVKKEQKKKRKA